MTNKHFLCFFLALAVSNSVMAEDVFNQPHALNVNLFDSRSGQPINDGIHYVEVDIVDNVSGQVVGNERYHCTFFNGLCSIPVSQSNLTLLDNLKGVSFLINAPELVNENSVSFDISNVSVSVGKMDPENGSVKYEPQPVLYARVAKIASNVVGDITPNTIDTSSISIKGEQVINEQGEWVGRGVLKGDKGDVGPKGDKGDTGSKGDTGDTGATGATGARGETGARGDTGAKGDRGPRGYTGSRGPRGYTGPVGPSGDSGSVCMTSGTNNTYWQKIPAPSSHSAAKAVTLEFLGRESGDDFYVKLFLGTQTYYKAIDEAVILESSIPGVKIARFLGGDTPTITFNHKLNGLKLQIFAPGVGKARQYSILGTSKHWVQGCFKAFSF